MHQILSGYFRGAKAEVMGEGSAMEGLIGSCLVIILFGKRNHSSGLASRQLVERAGSWVGIQVWGWPTAEVKSLDETNHIFKEFMSVISSWCCQMAQNQEDQQMSTANNENAGGRH